jgi:diadenosine tetraphosphate (Ap4A) HIT family hydrolase
VVAQTRLARAVLDGYPAVPGHILVYPIRHVEKITDLRWREAWHMFRLIRKVCRTPGFADHTIGVNGGDAAGWTIRHLHCHIFPRRRGDVRDPRGGVRQLFFPSPDNDHYLHRQ